MDEREWLACTKPGPMVAFLQPRASGRKLRLCATAWARLFLEYARFPLTRRLGEIRAWLTEPHWSAMLGAAEQFADGRIDRKALRIARGHSGGPWNLFLAVCSSSPRFSLAGALYHLQLVQREFRVPFDLDLCGIIRDILGNPLRPVALDPAWQVPAVLALAQAAYDNRTLPTGTLEPERLAVLADALEESGCTDADILGHLRGPGPHVRGCFAVDLLLGKS